MELEDREYLKVYISGKSSSIQPTAFITNKSKEAIPEEGDTENEPPLGGPLDVRVIEEETEAPKLSVSVSLKEYCRSGMKISAARESGKDTEEKEDPKGREKDLEIWVRDTVGLPRSTVL
jgi:hypothetical protein